jgi:hypothetical protein
MIVYVLTDAEAGWDCVRGVFKTPESLIKEMVRKFPNLEGLDLDDIIEFLSENTGLVVSESILEE